MRRHGMAHTGMYKAWAEMRRRCENPKSHAWADYGGRGIAVCERWRLFENFLADMGERPLGASLDRIDNDKGYEPGNCRWATKQQQARNKRSNARHVAFGEAKTCAEWVQDPRCAVTAEDSLKSRILRGWSVERAITEPPADRGQLRLLREENTALRRVLQGQG